MSEGTAAVTTIRIDDHFQGLTDPRRREGTYPLVNIVVMALCGVLSSPLKIAICDPRVAGDTIGIAVFCDCFHAILQPIEKINGLLAPKQVGISEFQLFVDAGGDGW